MGMSLPKLGSLSPLATKIIILSGLLIIVIIAIVVGVLVGTSNNKNLNSLRNSNSQNVLSGPGIIITSAPTFEPTQFNKPTQTYVPYTVTYGPVPPSLMYCQLSQALTCSGAELSQGMCASTAGFCGLGAAYCTTPAFDAACFRFYKPNPYPAAAPVLNGAYPSYPGGFSTGTGLNLYSNGCKMPGVIALTFDDGPGPYTSTLLDTLLSLNIKATFLLIGQKIQGYTLNGFYNAGYQSVVQRMISEGHVVGDHSWTHPYFSQLPNTTQAIDNEVVQTSNAIFNVTGLYPKYFRFPYFDFTPFQMDYILNTLNHIVLFNDLDTYDYEPVNQSGCPGSSCGWINNFNSKIIGSDPTLASFIVLNHDTWATTANNIQVAIATGLKAGYRFVTIEECLGFSAYMQ